MKVISLPFKGRDGGEQLFFLVHCVAQCSPIHQSQTSLAPPLAPEGFFLCGKGRGVDDRSIHAIALYFTVFAE